MCGNICQTIRHCKASYVTWDAGIWCQTRMRINKSDCQMMFQVICRNTSRTVFCYKCPNTYQYRRAYVRLHVRLNVLFGAYTHRNQGDHVSIRSWVHVRTLAVAIRSTYAMRNVSEYAAVDVTYRIPFTIQACSFDGWRDVGSFFLPCRSCRRERVWLAEETDDFTNQQRLYELLQQAYLTETWHHQSACSARKKKVSNFHAAMDRDHDFHQK